MAQSRAGSTWDINNYGKYIHQFPPNTIKSIRQYERINKKICRQKMSIMFNEICVYISAYLNLIYLVLFTGEPLEIIPIYIPKTTTKNTHNVNIVRSSKFSATKQYFSTESHIGNIFLTALNKSQISALTYETHFLLQLWERHIENVVQVVHLSSAQIALMCWSRSFLFRRLTVLFNIVYHSNRFCPG